MVEYKKNFLDKMKALFYYFVKFCEEESILLKNYLENCIVGRPNKRLIIMIIYNKSTYLVNDKWQKI